MRSGERVIARSGHIDSSGNVDPWSYFLNAYVLDSATMLPIDTVLTGIHVGPEVPSQIGIHWVIRSLCQLPACD